MRNVRVDDAVVGVREQDVGGGGGGGERWCGPDSCESPPCVTSSIRLARLLHPTHKYLALIRPILLPLSARSDWMARGPTNYALVNSVYDRNDCSNLFIRHYLLITCWLRLALQATDGLFCWTTNL